MLRYGYDINQLVGDEWVKACKELIAVINSNVHTVKLDFMYWSHRNYACDLAHALGVVFDKNGNILLNGDCSHNYDRKEKKKNEYRNNYYNS